ncbi:SAM-dependent methyltransferase [Povalibacter uvarum]|uniref:SAM-dependent methyltransferase n=1 Tax=Povalibacter uvarum TaxID=732238 RepID=A0A841HFF7_9GAMM|nr:class I SAM-dependent methyltransferase [Povalibacter uvarum]MBB6091607.1 SAM-dependent methyltransferase [Povalibacter uvarum]
MTDFAEVTELAGDDVSGEQVQRVCTRYAWALPFCRSKDVVEVACGTGPGLGLLRGVAKSLVAGDISETILGRARAHYRDAIDLRTLDAQALPFEDASVDVVIIFEALYYLPRPELFFAECRRVLRPGGHVLISNANKDLSDFNPSPHSHVYHGVVELREAFAQHGFSASFFGDVPMQSVSWRQKLLRPVKRAVVALNLMPKSMAGKKLLKKLVFGSMSPFPAEITPAMLPTALTLAPLDPARPDQVHKVILCAARKS